jgi:hypothetical protein
MTSDQDIEFPPLAQLPPGVALTRLPIVGKTWYTRGFAYWARRTGCVLLLCGAVAFYTTLIADVVLLAGRPGSSGFLAALLAESVFSLGTGVLAFRHLWRLGISGQATHGSPRRGAAGASGGLALSRLGVLGGFILVSAVLLSAGFLLGALAIWLVPVPPAERHARNFLACELQLQPHHRHSFSKRRA